jgi:hypothetical protein
MRKLLLAGILSLAVFAGCGTHDAKIEGRDTGSAEAVNFPNHVSNVFTKCNHGNRIYVTDHGTSDKASGLSVVAHDPSCGR